jgi:hypothetical protein
MWPYVTPQPREIRHTAPAINLKYPSLLRACLSTTQPRKQEQAVSAISSTTLTCKTASFENLFSNIDILGLQSQENARGKSTAAGTTLALVRVAQPFTAGEQRLGANYQEQEDASKVTNTRLPPVSKTCSKELYWQKIPLWQDISEERFQEYKWQVSCYGFTESYSVPQGTC